VIELDRYILVAWLKSFCGTVCVMLALMLVFEMYEQAGDLIQYGSSGEQLLRYMALVTPAFLPSILPLALLVSLMFSLTSLQRHNEIMAMRTAGWSMWRLSRWLWIGALALAGVQFWLNARVAPSAQESAAAYYQQLREASGIPLERQTFYTLGYDDHASGRLWFLNRFDPAENTGYGVTVHTRNSRGEELRRILARRATFNPEKGFWTFFNGRVIQRDPVMNIPVRSLSFKVLERPTLTTTPRLMMALQTKPNDLSLFQLNEALASLGDDHPLRPALAVRQQRAFTGPLVCFFLVGIAVPLAVTGVRTSAMANIFKAAGLFVVYFVLTTLCVLLGERLVIPVMVAAWAPQVVLLAAAFWLFNRAT
jgi:lipopolysaccharide export system permease protein